MARCLRFLFGLLIFALLVGGPYAYWRYRSTESPRFLTVREGVLYRSGQMTLAGMKRAIRGCNLKTVISLRDAHKAGDPPPDHDEEKFCRDLGLTYYRLSPKPWSGGPNGTVPADENVIAFRKIISNPANYPVLIHCWAGRHRTGAYCAIYRMEQEHWSNEDAIAEMLDNGYDSDLFEQHEDLRAYLEHYRPTWQNSATLTSAVGSAEPNP